MVRGGLATTAGGRWVAAALGRRPGGTTAVKGRGKSERGPRGFYPLPRLGLGRSGGELFVEAGGGGRAECGGGAGSLGRELGAAVEVVGEMSCAGSLFIGRVRRWRRSEAVAAAGELGAVPLMALGRLRASAAQFAAATRRLRQRARGGAGCGA